MQFCSAKNTRKGTHKTRKPLFPSWKHQKTNFKEIFSSEKVNAEIGALSSQNASFKSKTNMKVKGVPFDQLKNFPEKSRSVEKTVGLIDNSHQFHRTKKKYLVQKIKEVTLRTQKTAKKIVEKFQMVF